MALPRDFRSIIRVLVLASGALVLHWSAAAPCLAGPPDRTVEGMVHADGHETFSFTFAFSGQVTVELAGFPPDCAFQVGSQGFQASDTSPVGWTDGEPGRPVAHSFIVQAGRPGSVWVELRSRISEVSRGNWKGVVCSKDGPCYTTPDRGGPIEAGPVSYEGRPVRPPITFRLTAGFGGGGAVPSTPSNPLKTSTLRDDILKFSCDHPDSWVAVSTGRDSYRIAGREGTPEAEVSVAITVVPKSGAPDDSAWRQLFRVHENLTAGGAEVVKLGPAFVAGQSAPFASHAYNAGNSQGQTIPFDHVQLVLERGSRYYLISFAAPHEVFVKQALAFKRILGSWSFLP